MFNTNWHLNINKPTENVDWSALADTWLQQREQQAQWQQAPLPPPPPPPPFLLSTPPIPPPGPRPIGMTYQPLPPTQLGIGSHHHQLQVGSNTTQESLTMTNIENSLWRSPLPPPPPLPSSLMMPSGPQWRPTTNNNQSLFPIPSEITPSFGGRNFWPPGSTGQQAKPPSVPPPVPAPALSSVPPQKSQTPSQFPAASFQHPPVDKRMMNTSFNTSIPSLMDLPSSYGQKPIPLPMPVPPVPILPSEPVKKMANIPSGNNTNAKRRKIPPWLRDALGRIEKEKEKKMQNTSNNNLSINDSSSKFDENQEEEDDDDDENGTNNRTFNESTTAFNDDEENDQNEDEESSSTLISSTPNITRRSRFDDDKSTDLQLNVSAISKRTYSPPLPSPTTTTLIEDDEIDQEEQLIKLRRTLTELLLEVTNEELASIAKEVYLNCKAELSTPVIRKSSGLSSLIQSFFGTDSDDDDNEEEKDIQSTLDTTVIKKSPIETLLSKQNNDTSVSKSTTKTSIDDSKSNKDKKKKSSRDRSPSKKYHHKKHRHHSSSSSSSSSSNSSQSRSKKKKRSYNHDQYSEHNKSKKYDDRGRKH